MIKIVAKVLSKIHQKNDYYNCISARRMGPIPWMLMGELFPAETKAIASGLAVMLNWLLVFFVTKTFPAMKEGLGPDVTFWIFAGIMVAGTAFTYFFIPETKGKSFQEILRELQGGSRTKPANVV